MADFVVGGGSAQIPTVMVHPMKSGGLMANKRINANVAGFMGWSRLLDALRKAGEVRPDEEVEALVLLDDGIQIYYRRK